MEAAEVAVIGARVGAGVGIEIFFPIASIRNAYPVGMAAERREVCDNEKGFFCIERMETEEADDAILTIVRD